MSMSVIKHIVAKMSRRSLKLRIGGINKVFVSPEEFVHFLSERLTVPSESMEHFSQIDKRSLRKEARKMLHAYQNVIDIMANSKQTGETLANLWRRLDISKVPDDHDWPSILFALGNNDDVFDDYRREALSNYIQFLDTRRKAVDSLRDRSGSDDGSESALTSMPLHGSAGSRSGMLNKSIDDYSRLPHRHSVELSLDSEADITVFLGKNRFKLSKHAETLTLKESGAVHAYTLKPGRYTVGRSSECDIHLDGRQADISRQHLIVEVTTERLVSMTDISSRGTYVRPGIISEKHSDTATGQR